MTDYTIKNLKKVFLAEKKGKRKNPNKFTLGKEKKVGDYLLIGVIFLMAGFVLGVWYKEGRPVEQLKPSSEKNPNLYYYRSRIEDYLHCIYSVEKKRVIIWQSKNKVINLKYGDNFYVDKSQDVIRYYKPPVSKVIWLNKVKVNKSERA